MKKAYKKPLQLCLIITMVIVITMFLFSAWNDWKIAIRETDAYVDYTCRDFHLVSLKNGKRIGDKKIEIGNSTYEFYYNLIPDISEEDFVAARKKPLVHFPDEAYEILQSPENKIDVLNDWNIKEIQLYYFDWGDIRNHNKKDGPVENWVINVFASSSDELMIQQVLDMSLNKKIETGMSYKNDSKTYKNIIPEKKDVYMRILFEESEYIAWDAAIDIYQSKTDETQYVVTVYGGCRTESNEDYRGYYMLDASSELYEMIINAYTEGKISN